MTITNISDLYSRYASGIADGPLRVTYPLLEEGDSSHCLLSQDYVQTAKDYAPIALNTAFNVSLCNAPSYSLPSGAATAVFVGDTDVSYIPPGLRKYTRNFMSVPASRPEYSSISFTYPGFDSLRDQFAQTVPLKRQLDYFLVTTGTPDAITLLPETKVTFGTGYVVPIGGGVDLNNGGGVLLLSNPSTNTYKTWITSGTYSIVTEPSIITQLRGNIYVRSTNYVKPL